MERPQPALFLIQLLVAGQTVPASKRAHSILIFTVVGPNISFCYQGCLLLAHPKFFAASQASARADAFCSSLTTLRLHTMHHRLLSVPQQSRPSVYCKAVVGFSLLTRDHAATSPHFPARLQTYFFRSCIFLFEHSEQGSAGLILNRRGGSKRHTTAYHLR